MEFGEQEGEEGCIRKEAKEARDQGFSDGIRGRAGEVRSRPGLPRDGSWVEDGSGSFRVPLDSRGASEPSSLKSRHPRGWESPQVPEVIEGAPGLESPGSHSLVRPRDPLPASHSPIYLGAEDWAGDSGSAGRRAGSCPRLGAARRWWRDGGARLGLETRVRSSGQIRSGDSGGSRFC